MKFEFKKAEEKDWEIISFLEKSVSEKNNYYSPIIKENEVKEYIKKSTVFIIEKEGKAVGTVSYEIKDKNHIYFDGLTVHPDYQKQKIATKAMEFVINRIGKVKKIDLHVHPKNTPAIKLYLNFGFKIDSWVENHFGDGEPRIILVKGN